MAEPTDQFADAEEEEDVIAVIPGSSSERELPAEEEQSTETNGKKRPAEDQDPSSSSIPAHAKARLSKWAARLFDPNRIKGLVEPPLEIPLSDEFLSAFGKKEKQADATNGVTLEVDTAIEDENMEEEDAADATANEPSSSLAAPTPPNRKVKIQNIKYTTTSATLEHVCGTFGAVEKAHLLMDPTHDDRNTGLAYVTFVTGDAATGCCEKLKYIDGRDVRVSMAAAHHSSRTPGTSSHTTAGTRYWRTEDLATKCFKCGQTGHRIADCPNQPKAKPCCLCASIEEGHEVRNCRMKMVCFQCGVPGHAVKDCTARQRVPRLICTNCFQTDHHRAQCRNACNPAAAADAICATCGQTGHFSCAKPTFFFGLLDRFCSNCGRPGHWVDQCRRPRPEECARQPHILDAELNQATNDPDVIEYVMGNVQRYQERQQQQQQQRHPPRRQQQQQQHGEHKRRRRR